MSCKISKLSKYQKRKSPSIPANDCELGTIKTGNDGNLWQIVSAGKSQRWVKCGTGTTDCDSQPPKKTIKSLNNIESNKQHYLVKGKVALIKVDKSREKLPDKKTFFDYMTKTNKKNGFNFVHINDLVNDIAEYQFLYDKIYNINLDQNLNLSFNITNINGSKFSDYRKREYDSEIMSESQIKQDLIESINNFADGCYEGIPPNECLYPNSEGDELAEITVKNLSVKKVLNPNSKSDKKTKKNTKPIKKPSRKILDSNTDIRIKYKSSVKKKSKTSKSIKPQ